MLSCSPSPTLTHLSLSRLPSPSHPTWGSCCPISSHFPCVPPPFSHVCATPEVGAVPLGQSAPPLLSVWSGPQPPAQLSLGQERHVSCAPGGRGDGGGQKNGRQCPWWGEEGDQPSAWKACPAPPTATHSQGLGIEVAESIGNECLCFLKNGFLCPPLFPPLPSLLAYVLSRHS